MSKLIVANWKSNFNLTQTATWLEQFFQLCSNDPLQLTAADLEVVLAPPFPLIFPVKQWLEQTTAILADAIETHQAQTNQSSSTNSGNQDQNSQSNQIQTQSVNQVSQNQVQAENQATSNQTQPANQPNQNQTQTESRNQTDLQLANQLLSDFAQIGLAAQNVSQFSSGQYTGAVCTDNLIELSVKHIIVGHSERRRFFGESSEVVAHKVGQAVSSGFTPLVCVDQDQIKNQADQIKQLNPELLSRTIVAYEPTRLIGSGQAADPNQVQAVANQIKSEFGQLPVIYGGSVTADNVSQYLAITDGVLVGGASLDPSKFIKLILAAQT
ncbi:MAG: hypothetical protein GF381_02455 [Candidatus Pacebacteria bacterium]|nr:hypothetical protein [Candidatus Paceibacterota bacterium]